MSTSGKSRKSAVSGQTRSMMLTGADRDAFLDALRHPPVPTSRLATALKRHGEAAAAPRQDSKGRRRKVKP